MAKQEQLIRTRVLKDKVAHISMIGLTGFSLLILLLMGVGLWYKSRDVIAANSLWELISSSVWKPNEGQFGFLPYIVGTVCITLLSIVIALPVSLLTGIFLTENARPWVKRFIFPVLDILAGIPSVIYGVWGTLLIVPFIADRIGPHFVEYTSGYSVLAGGLVMGVMIIPLLVSLFVEIFSVIPNEFREAAYSLGATKWQTSYKIVLRKAAPGIIAAVVLAVSRALGETIAVLMVCGNVAILPESIFDSCYPLPALIANNYGEMLSIPIYESALMFAAFILFFVIFLFNAGSRVLLQRVESRFAIR
ncbi:MAG: phosphate ABC transporter permease subunit PstC [Tannerellaceae bacterium]|nr:phosphate ABC transporter permease subunit PstC [Tannerellaceae bacterium]